MLNTADKYYNSIIYYNTQLKSAVVRFTKQMYKTDCKYAVSMSEISLLKLKTGVESIQYTLLNMLYQSLIVRGLVYPEG